MSDRSFCAYSSVVIATSAAPCHQTNASSEVVRALSAKSRLFNQKLIDPSMFVKSMASGRYGRMKKALDWPATKMRGLLDAVGDWVGGAAV